MSYSIHVYNDGDIEITKLYNKSQQSLATHDLLFNTQEDVVIELVSYGKKEEDVIAALSFIEMGESLSAII